MKSKMVMGDILEGIIAARIQELNAEQYMQFVEDHRGNIKSVKFVPPRIGSASFGRFEVETDIPHYEVCLP